MRASTVDTPVATGHFEQWLDNRRQRVEDALCDHLNRLKSAASPHTRLLAAVEYSVAGGGKRLRPLLVLEAAAVCGGNAADAMPAALAVECVHAFSLIHDDLPAMDDDDLRRGRPTNHKVFGEALAILSGDWLAAHAFALLASDMQNQATVARVSQVLASAMLEMVEGQAADIEHEGRPADAGLVEYIHAHKTAGLIDACCRIGAVCGGADEAAIAAMGRYGRHLGTAFQVVDDLLDCTGTTDTLGKRAGKDADAAKQTYPAAFGLEASRERARQEVAEAVEALTPFGAKADRLRELAAYVVGRDR